MSSPQRDARLALYTRQEDAEIAARARLLLVAQLRRSRQRGAVLARDADHSAKIRAEVHRAVREVAATRSLDRAEAAETRRRAAGKVLEGLKALRKDLLREGATGDVDAARAAADLLPQIAERERVYHALWNQEQAVVKWYVGRPDRYGAEPPRLPLAPDIVDVVDLCGSRSPRESRPGPTRSRGSRRSTRAGPDDDPDPPPAPSSRRRPRSEQLAPRSVLAGGGR